MVKNDENLKKNQKINNEKIHSLKNIKIQLDEDHKEREKFIR